MTDEPTIEEAQDALGDARSDLNGATSELNSVTSLDRYASELHEAEQALDQALTAVGNIWRDLEDEEERLERVADGNQAAIEMLDILSDILDELDGDGTPDYAGRLVTGNGVFEVSIEQVEETTFMDWLTNQMRAHEDLTREYLLKNSLVSEERLDEMMAGDDPNGDEGPSLLKTVKDGGFISPEEHDQISERFFGDDGDPEDPLDDLFG